MSSATPLRSIVILAGRRDGVVDPFAAAHGVDDKCLVPVAGVPMIRHILQACDGVEGAPRIVVSVNDPVAIRAALGDGVSGTVQWIKARGNIADSVLDAVRGLAFPLIITTADACLLTTRSLAELHDRAQDAGADAAVGLAIREAVLEVHPEGQRRFYSFADVAVSNCNAYWIANEAALVAVETFRGGGQFVKKPVRVMQAFGLINLLRFRFGMGKIDRVFAGLSRRLGLRLVPVLLTDGAAAIDVDNDRSLRVTEAVLAKRAIAPPITARVLEAV